MLSGAKVAVCSEINTKHINTVWKNVKFFKAKPVGATRNQNVLKGKFTVYVSLVTVLKDSVSEIFNISSIFNFCTFRSYLELRKRK
jgi:hypothetical protein